MAKVGIVGASGFTGAELLRICASHPELDVAFASGDGQAGNRIADLYPSLAPAYGDLRFASYEPDAVGGLDLVFLGLPHGASQGLVPELEGRVGLLVDLAADFRLQDASHYPRWYGAAHACPEWLPRFAYGLPELFRDDLVGATHVAAPGCYVTTAALGLRPLVDAGLIETSGVVVDAASGVSGAGRPPKPGTTFCAVDESFSAYGLLDHRHTPEMEQAIGAQLIFTPHLAPMNRGILATSYARPAVDGLTTADVIDALRRRYREEPFVTVLDADAAPPTTKATLGSNSCHLTARVDPRTGWVLTVSALDNLVKGASGQAVQCANLLLGVPETTGLAVAGLFP